MKDAAAYADGNLYFSRTSIFVNMLWVGRYLNSGSISSDVARPDLSCRLLILIASGRSIVERVSMCRVSCIGFTHHWSHSQM